MPPSRLVLNEAQLVADYASGKPLRVVAKLHGVGNTTAWRRLKALRVERRRPGHRGRRAWAA